MSTNYRSRRLVVALATLVAGTLLAPLAGRAQEEVAVLAPVAAPAGVSPSPEELRSIRAIAAESALLSGDIGSMQEEALVALVAAAPSWEETSGYRAVEASRALNALPAAPDASTSTEQTRVLAAQQALQGADLGSLQEEALFAVVAAGPSWDETSGYGALEASRAANALSVAPTATTQVPAGVRWAPAGTIAPVAAPAAVNADALALALATGTRVESVHLATIALPAAALSADSEQTRVLAAQQALLAPDLGSLQEEALTAVVADSADVER